MLLKEEMIKLGKLESEFDTWLGWRLCMII